MIGLNIRDRSSMDLSLRKCRFQLRISARIAFTALSETAGPVGLVWGEQDGEVLFHPDEAVTGAIRTVFERFAEFGSARRVGLWFRSEGLSFPLQTMPAGMPGPIRWVTPTYHALHQILTNPVYAGAYTYGKTRYERYVDEQGVVKK
ncbi:MAG: recombinase family protein, partial [Acidobacteriia bacterium]|nr:recombinase family protein [Terriglobia bacterium]